MGNINNVELLEENRAYSLAELLSLHVQLVSEVKELTGAIAKIRHENINKLDIEELKRDTRTSVKLLTQQLLETHSKLKTFDATYFKIIK